MGVPWKGQEKNKIKGGGYLKRGAWIVLRFKRGLGEKGGVFEGWGLIRQCKLIIFNNYYIFVSSRM